MQSSLYNKPNYPKTAIMLAAGLGTRLRPLTNSTPKPLVKVAGKTLLEYGLELLIKAGVEKVVINTHYLADQLTDFVNQIQKNCPIELVISDERKELLDSAGGIIKALPLLGDSPFYVLNADSFWQESADIVNFLRLAENFTPDTQDMLLLTLLKTKALTPQKGDFIQDIKGHLVRADKTKDNAQAVIYTGGLILNPAIFAQSKTNTAQSLNIYFDKALAQKRLYGLNLQATWHSVGSVAELESTETYLKQHNN